MDVNEAEFIKDFLSNNQLTINKNQLTEGVNKNRLEKTRNWFNYLESKSNNNLLKTPSNFFSNTEKRSQREVAIQYEEYFKELEDIYTGRQFNDFNFENEIIQQYIRWNQK